LNLVAMSALAAVALFGGIPRSPGTHLASGKIAATSWPYLPGSSIPLKINGFAAPYHAALLGPGRLLPSGVYEIPQKTAGGTAFLIAGNRHGLAATHLQIAAPPAAERSLLLVASYEDGLVFHDAGSFSVLGILATGGAPSDAAVDVSGRIAATDTDGTQLTVATLSPWSVEHVDDVLVGDQLAIDPATQAIFVTNRDINGSGALTRVTRTGDVTRVLTGVTAEGLVIDARRHIVYVANTNDGTVAAVDARSMRVLRRFNAVARVFSLALSSDGATLYAISNQSAGSPFAAAGSAVAIDLRSPKPHVVARSPNLAFPLGAALDSASRTLFVTDEELSRIEVLDAVTLRRKRSSVRTCATPWKPTYDEVTGRLYVPCAGSDSIDVFDARTLRRVERAPFRTGGYPLSVAIWHPNAS
jgi:DNA-binding beta-propeller fold protein YncE